MATSKKIKAHVKAQYGFVPDDCWIAHAKLVRRGSDGKRDPTVDISTSSKRCSETKRRALFQALDDFGM